MQPSNVLKIDSLNEEWCDKDGVMLHACFQLLVDVIEKERLFECDIDWEHSEKVRLEKQEVLAVYNWWLGYRITRDNEDIELENEMLIRLINIRSILWV